MAARKKAKTLSSSGSLFTDAALTPTEPAPPIVPAGGAIPETTDAPEVPRMRLVEPLKPVSEEEVIIEAREDGRFVVSLLRDHGSTVAAVLYTRSQLLMLLRRIPPALEMHP